jgi:hypothetical protein
MHRVLTTGRITALTFGASRSCTAGAVPGACALLARPGG